MTRLSADKLSGPDGVEAWTVAFAACIINFVMAGLARMSGILYVAFIDIFQIDRREASLPFSVRSSMRNLFGPVVGILGQKYGVRPVSMIGAVTGALGAGICFYAQDILWVTILWGGVCGVAASLATTLNQAVIGQHFKKYKTTAAGMAFSGGCVGSFLFPVLLEYLLDRFGVQGTFLLIAGILMHVIPATLLLRKPKWLNRPNPKVQISTVSHRIKNMPNIQQAKVTGEISAGISHENDMKKKKCCEKMVKDCLSNADTTKNSIIPVHEINTNWKINKEFLWNNRHFIISLFLKNSHKNLLNTRVFLREISEKDSETKEIEELFKKMIFDICNDRNIFKEFSDDTVITVDDNSFSTNANDKYSSENIQTNSTLVLSIDELSNINNSNLINFLSITLKTIFDTDVENIISISPETDKENLVKIFNELKHVDATLRKYINSDANHKITPSNSFYSHIKTACSLYTKPIFLLVCLCRTIHMVIAMPLFTTLVDFSMDKGLPKEDGKYVIAALSLGDLLGRLCLGWISDRGYVTLPRFMMIGMLFQGAFLASLSLMYSKATLLSAIAVCGLLQGCLFVRHPVLVNRYLENNEQSIAMGCLNFFSGLLAFLLPVYIGFFRDVIGSYNGILYINGAAAAFVGLLWGFEKKILHLSGSVNKNIEVQ